MSICGTRRKGVGTIVGASFFLLILTAGFATYFLTIREEMSLQDVIKERNIFDLDKAQEKIEVLGLYIENTGNFVLEASNEGVKTVTIKYVGVCKESEPTKTPSYYNVDLAIKSLEYINYTFPSIILNNEEQYVIQFLTEKGNIIKARCPSSLREVNEDEVNEIIEEHFTGYVGNITLQYGTFQWALRNPKEQVTGFNWVTDWSIPEGPQLVLRVNITNVSNSTYVLDDSTSINIQSLIGSNFANFYIVFNEGTYSEPYLGTYDGNNVVELSPWQTETLYFCVSVPGGSVNDGGKASKINFDGQAMAILLVLDNSKNYGQSLPFIGLEIY